MPNLDRTGPLGKGPLTGRGRGLRIPYTDSDKPIIKKKDIIPLVIIGGLLAIVSYPVIKKIINS